MNVMKKTISTLSIAAVSCALFGTAAYAQPRMDETIIEQRTTREVVEEPVRVIPKTRVYSGETLAGRREKKADDALIFREGNDRRAVFRDNDGELESEKVRGFIGEEDDFND